MSQLETVAGQGLKVAGAPARRWRNHLSGIAVAPAVVLLIVFFLVPTFFIARYSFLSAMPFFDPNAHFTFENYLHVLSEPLYLRVYITTLEYALTATVISLVISYPAAWYLAKRTRHEKELLILLLIPFWTSILIRAFAWRIILGPSGVINSLLIGSGLLSQPLDLLYNWKAVIFGLVFTYLPFMILPLYSALGKIPDELLEASEDLGAHKLETFLRVTLPLSLRGVLTALVIVFVASFGDFISAQLLGGSSALMVSNIIFETFYGSSNWPLGAALSFILFASLLIMAAVVFQAGKWAERGRNA
jgi:spermidine/putrescine transport system permease protein